MQASDSDPHDGVDQHADKYNDPRVVVTRRHVLALVAVLIGGTLFTFASIYARRTRLEKTTDFWGDDTIAALQLADHVELIPGPGSDFKQIELTAFPGLGHLRKALLDERHYEWDSVESASVRESFPETPASPGAESSSDVPSATDARSSTEPKPQIVRLEFSDPHYNRMPTTRIDVELASGTVGPADGSKRVRVNDRVRPALRHQLGLLMKVSEQRYGMRE